ncbi:YARHG domain-containing protein [Aquimarina sp. 433]
MKHTIFLILSLLIIACKKEVQKEKTEITPVIESEIVKEQNTSIKKEEKETDEQYSHKNTILENVMVPFTPRFFKEASDHQNLLGFYVGYFQAKEFSNKAKNPSYSNKINISINHITKDSIFGHSVVAGNARPFKGLIRFKTKIFVEATEPGDDKYDGQFDFTIYPDEEKIIGRWYANNKDLAVTVREYTLNKRKFIYNAESNLSFDIDYDYNLALYDSQDDENGELEAISSKVIGELNASIKELTNTDVENLNKGELEVLRNLIYARHGYSFKNRKMRYFFDSNIDWYIPVSTDIRGTLTDLEKKNIDLIKRYEQHAERYYDYFGR